MEELTQIDKERILSNFQAIALTSGNKDITSIIIATVVMEAIMPILLEDEHQ